MRTPDQIILANGRTLADVLADHRRWLLGDGGSRADLSGAVLRGAVLSGADLSGADLRDAVLSGADLSGADLRDAVLSGADLRGAVLSGAVLSGAVLSGADLRDAVLSGADLSEIREDVRRLVSDYATPEVVGLFRALHLGRVNGSCYHPDCGMACLVGTIALCKQVDVGQLPQDATRLAERWALALRPGDSVRSSEIAELTAEWVQSVLAERPDYDKAHPYGQSWLASQEASADSAPVEQLEALALELLDRAESMR